MAKRPQTPIILDDDDDDDRPSRREREKSDRSRDGFEMGLASAIIGATFLIIGMLAPLLIVSLSRRHYDGDMYSTRGDSLTEVVLFFGLVGAEAICLIGVILGRRGISRSRSGRTTTAMPLAGLLLNLVAMFLWLLVASLVIAGVP